MHDDGVTNLRDKTAICGVGNSRFGRFTPDLSPLDLVHDAFEMALDDSGLTRDDIDGVLINIGTPLGVDYDQVAEGLGLDVAFTDETWMHGRSLASVLTHAALGVSAGLAKYAACVCGVNWTRLGTVGGHEFNQVSGHQEDREIVGGAHFESPPHGMSSAGGAYAMAARKYFDKYGATSRDLAELCVDLRYNATLNPNAVRREPLTVEQHQASRLVCEPLHLFDYCQTTGGAAVVIVTTAPRARACKKPPVYMMGFQGMRAGRKEAHGTRPGMGVMQQDENEPVPRDRDLRVYEMAGVTQKDVDALYTYDAMSSVVWPVLERFGFCGPGEGWQFTKGGSSRVDGKLPINSGGGLLNETHISAWNHICEITRQLRGECGPRQIEGVEIAQWATNRGDSILFRR